MIYIGIDKLGLLRVAYVTWLYENPIIIACENINLFDFFPHVNGIQYLALGTLVVTKNHGNYSMCQ